MYSNADIAAIHQQIKKLYGHSLILLGGSYAYGEATPESDVDFYLIAPLVRILYYRFTKSKNKLKRYPGTNLILIPQSFYRRGWYYVYGKDDCGSIHYTPINKPIVFRNSLKLSYFNYLKFLITDGAAKSYHLAKAIKCAITAQAMIEGGQFDSPLLSKGFIASRLRSDTNNVWSAFTNVLEKGVMNQMELQLLGDTFLNLTTALYTTHKDMLRFSFVNYLIYNLKFLLWQGKVTFLFRNPDKFILEKIDSGLARGVEPQKLYQQVAQIIFPIVML